MLRQAQHIDAGRERQRRAAQTQRWKHQRRGWGTLLVMCSLLVGCLIPIAAGLFNNSELLGPSIAVLAGLAGLLLISGSMLLMAADGEILTAEDAPADDDLSRGQRQPGMRRTAPLPAGDTSASGTRYDEPATYAANR
jgi:hypothetical protein